MVLIRTQPKRAREMRAMLDLAEPRSVAPHSRPLREPVLGAGALAAFDDVAALAANVCATPISLLTFFDSQHVWSTSELDDQTRAELSLLTAALNGTKTLLIADTRDDARFASSPLVTGEAGIRFCAGVPLVSRDGVVVGTLAVFDRMPRELSAETVHGLESLARQAIAQLDLRRTAEALEQSERRFRSIIEEANEAYISFAEDGVIREWNREAEKLLGWSRYDIIGSSVRETVVPADLWQRVVAALAEGHDRDDAPLVVTRVDGTAMTKAGIEIPVEFTFLPLKIGGETRVNVLLHDISERRGVAVKRERLLETEQAAGVELTRVAVDREALLKTEQEAGVELTTQNEHLRALDALKDQFVSVVSHELRTPLTAIRGYLEILLGEEPGPLNEEQRRFLGIADFSSEQLLRVVGDLLLIGKVEAGHLGLELADVDLAGVIERCVLAAEPAAAANKVSLTLTVQELPAVTADLGRISQAVGNIISNAIKFTHDGRVDIVLHREKACAVIEITDTGPGIPAAEIAYLFVPFFRASTATREAIPGTGLGLSIAKEIVAAHGGDISVASKEGSGTSFRMELPIKEVAP